MRHSKFGVCCLSCPVCSTVLQEPRLGAEKADNLERAMGANKKAPGEPALSRQETRQQSKAGNFQTATPLIQSMPQNQTHPTTPAKVESPDFHSHPKCPTQWCQRSLSKAAEQQDCHPHQQVRRHGLSGPSGHCVGSPHRAVGQPHPSPLGGVSGGLGENQNIHQGSRSVVRWTPSHPHSEAGVHAGSSNEAPLLLPARVVPKRLRGSQNSHPTQQQ